MEDAVVTGVENDAVALAEQVVEHADHPLRAHRRRRHGEFGVVVDRRPQRLEAGPATVDDILVDADLGQEGVEEFAHVRHDAGGDGMARPRCSATQSTCTMFCRSTEKMSGDSIIVSAGFSRDPNTSTMSAWRSSP